jgi:ketosteroid isomerase-like protein
MIAAHEPEDLGVLFLERANAGDVEGLVALYEPEAVLALPAGRVARGSDAIRRFYRDLLASRPSFTAGPQQPPLVAGGVALTSTQLLDGGATAEVARQQADGTWLWAVDQPRLLP